MAKLLRDLRIAALDGDFAAMRSLLRRNGWPGLAAEVRRGKPVPPRVVRQIRALTAGTGTHEALGEWEHKEPDGAITNDLLDSPSPRQGSRARQ